MLPHSANAPDNPSARSACSRTAIRQFHTRPGIPPLPHHYPPPRCPRRLQRTSRPDRCRSRGHRSLSAVFRPAANAHATKSPDAAASRHRIAPYWFGRPYPPAQQPAHNIDPADIAARNPTKQSQPAHVFSSSATHSLFSSVPLETQNPCQTDPCSEKKPFYKIVSVFIVVLHKATTPHVDFFQRCSIFEESVSPLQKHRFKKHSTH